MDRMISYFDETADGSRPTVDHHDHRSTKSVGLIQRITVKDVLTYASFPSYFINHTFLLPPSALAVHGQIRYTLRHGPAYSSHQAKLRRG